MTERSSDLNNATKAKNCRNHANPPLHPLFEKAKAAKRKETIKLRITYSDGLQYDETCISYKFYPNKKQLIMRKTFPEKCVNNWKGVISNVEVIK